MLTVWGRKNSSNVQAVMWCIGELGLPYRRQDAGHRYGDTDTPAFLAMNPNGLVPVLRDGDDQPLWESGAIIRYLADRYGTAPFWPKDHRLRAQIDKWAEWSKINVALAFTRPVFWRVVRTAPVDQDPLAIAQGVAELERFLEIAEMRLARSSYLAGDDFTLADIQFGHVLFRYFDISIPRKNLPMLRRYYDGLASRPAFRDNVMVSYDELREPG